MGMRGGDEDRGALGGLVRRLRVLSAEVDAVAREVWEALRGSRDATSRARLGDVLPPPTIGRLN